MGVRGGDYMSIYPQNDYKVSEILKFDIPIQIYTYLHKFISKLVTREPQMDGHKVYLSPYASSYSLMISEICRLVVGIMPLLLPHL